MSARAQTVRLTPARHRALAGFAKSYGLSEYAMLARVVDAGLAALVRGAGNQIDNREIVSELASVSTRIVDVERMLDRALFTACCPTPEKNCVQSLARHSLPPTLALPWSRALIMPAISRVGSRSCKTTPAPLCRPQLMPNAPSPSCIN